MYKKKYLLPVKEMPRLLYILLPEKLIWMWKRLYSMSAPEIIYRIKTSIFNLLQKYGYFTAKHPPPPSLQRQSALWFGDVVDIWPTCYHQAGDKILQGNLSIFDLRDYQFGHPPKWNRDSYTGKTAPMLFSKTIDYRDESLLGDIKYLWEPSRHLQLVTLAQAYNRTNSKKYLDGIKLQLNSWFDQCPYLLGPQWINSLEIAIRLINWYLVWQLIGGLNSDVFKGKSGEDFQDRWLHSIYQHAHFIKNHYSLFSSANNHLIGEAAGLFISTTGWPFWAEFKKWQKSSLEILEREVLLQNTADGVNREQAISYQQFVLDFIILAYLTAKENHVDISTQYLGTIERMMEFIASMMDMAGHVPMIGDADDGFVVKLSQQENWCPYQSLLATGAVLFGRSDFYAKAANCDDKTRWLLGKHADIIFKTLRTKNIKLSTKRQFKEGGYYILGKNMGNKNEIKIAADAGPLGYLSIAAHGHADALSLTLSAGGNEILVDPGTYTYHTRKLWRNYFRGTSAHNTLRIDGQNQSVIGGNFLWLRKAQINEVTWNTNDEEDTLTASHDGYTRFSDPVRHQRTIQFSKIENTILITDSVKCQKEHLVEIFWHLAEDCKLEIKSNYVSICCGPVRVIIRLLDHSIKPQIIKGSNNPPLGWISRRFGIKAPIYTILWRERIKESSIFQSEISIKFVDEE